MKTLFLFLLIPILFSYAFAQESPTPKTISENLTPRMQVFNGVAPDGVICNSGLELIFKYSNGNPTCVKPDTAKRLLDVKWATKYPFGTLKAEALQYDERAGWLFSFCDKADGLLFQPFDPERGPMCNLKTSDAGTECTDSSQCESYCQANEGAEVGSKESGLCFEYMESDCRQVVRDGVVDTMLCT